MIHMHWSTFDLISKILLLDSVSIYTYQPLEAKYSRISLAVSIFVLYLMPNILCSLAVSKVTMNAVFSVGISG